MEKSSLLKNQGSFGNPNNGMAVLNNLVEWLSLTLNALQKNGEDQTSVKLLKYIGGEVLYAIDSINYLSKYEVWVEIENQMAIKGLEHTDVAGFVIIVRTRLKGDKFMEINLNR